MKKIIITLLLACSIFGAYSQTIKRNGNNFVSESVQNTKQAAQETKYTYTDTDGKTYSIWISKNGRAYIIKTSRNGKDYKKYLGEDVSKEICKEMGITYTEKTK